MRILLTGGGTGGHVIPNIALLPELRKYFAKIYYIGTSGIEKKLISEQKYVDFFEIDTPKFVRSFTFKNFLIPFKLFDAINKCKEILRQTQPDIVFSKGGFVSVPVVIAAKKLNIPVVSHESDTSLGLANKIIMMYCNKMCISFPNTSKNKKCVLTGNPVRKQMLNGDKNKISSLANFNDKKPYILFLGGSQGSKAINNAVTSNLTTLTKKYNVIHIVGKGNLTENKFNNYIQKEYVDNIEDYYAISDLVVCRSGANVLFELLALKKPMLLIPLENKKSRGDQVKNAIYFENYGYAKILREYQLHNDKLLDTIDIALKNSKNMIKHMESFKYPNSNEKIIKVINSCLNK